MWKLLIPIAVNLLLGIPAIIPMFLAYYVMSNGPLAALGWTQREPTENEGTLVLLLGTAPVFCLFGSTWGLVNLWMRPKVPVPAFQYWFACDVCLALQLAQISRATAWPTRPWQRGQRDSKNENLHVGPQQIFLVLCRSVGVLVTSQTGTV